MIEPGIHKALPAPDYHRRELGVVSNTALKQVRRSLAHYKSWVDGGVDKDTDALRFGRAFHCALLEPAKFEEAYIGMPKFGDCRLAENKAAKKAWLAAHAEHEHLDFDEMLTLVAMAESVRKHPLASQMIRDGEAELTLSWKDADSGLQCKSRLDYYVRDLAMIADVKTTEDASEEQFEKDVAKYGYHVQDALYRSAALALGMPVQHFVLIVVEKSPPFAVATYSLDADGIERGYFAARRDMDRLAWGLKNGRWPAYDETIKTIRVPPWAA